MWQPLNTLLPVTKETEAPHCRPYYLTQQLQLSLDTDTARVPPWAAVTKQVGV